MSKNDFAATPVLLLYAGAAEYRQLRNIGCTRSVQLVYMFGVL